MRHLKFGKFTTVYKGKIFNIKHQDVTLPSGEKTYFEFAERESSINVLAFNEKNELLMTREYRYGYKQPVWFIPAGRMDKKNESPRQAAQRELREETGYRAKTLKLVKKSSTSEVLIWDIYLFVAKNLVIDPLPKDENEEIETVFMPLKKAVQMALDGTVKNEYIAYSIIYFNHLLESGKLQW